MKKCRKIADLISKQRDQVRLSLFNRIALAVHLSFCPRCREYKKQLVLISNAMHKVFRRFKKDRLKPAPVSFKRPLYVRLIYR